jgi:hypothetical protein
MTSPFNRFLIGTAEGLLNPKGQQANWQHATRLFIDTSMRLMPRSKYLFYVNFEINDFAIRVPSYSKQNQSEVGLLVKTVDLPKYSFDTVTKNQYNRKKLVYKNFNYDPVNLTLHDDSDGVVNAMWAIYYGYYIADRQNPDTAYEANQYRPTKTTKDDFRYGMDNDITAPFFKSVSIYTMSKNTFLGYTLINPRIKSWSHGNGDYAASEFNESTMTLEYEAVKYSSGKVKYDTPKGFAMLHYDAVPSPISVAGGGVASLLGGGGVLAGIDQVFGNISDGTAFDSVGGFLGTAIGAVNTYRNGGKLNIDQIKNEALNVLSNPRNLSNAVANVKSGTVFPKNDSSNAVTTATAKSVVNPGTN